MDRSLHQNSLLGALWMVIAGITFAAINVLTPWISERYPINSSWIAFYQYLFALLFITPYLFHYGFKRILTTNHFKTHLWRIIVAVIGIQFWIKALTVPFPIGEGVALLMTSPLFASIGAILLLKERATPIRIIAIISGFIGAIIILAPNHQNVNWAALYPLAAALFWAIYALLMKHLSHHDHPLTMVAYLYILMIPINLLLALTHNGASFGPQSTLPILFYLPQLPLLLLLALLGGLTAIAQYAVAKAYSLADALFIQPFDYLKLPLNTLLGWLVFQWAVGIQFWIGAIIMVSSLLAISYFERHPDPLAPQKH